MEYLPHMPNSSKLHTDMDALQYEHLAEHSTIYCVFTDYNRSARAYLLFDKTELDIQGIEVLWSLSGCGTPTLLSGLVII